ncbi:DnaJ-domain-containing protein [Dacryopinax primogenitus]|uniref:DnaJ-domain-containing protein n=1 Tax=Dacryopinax primogenitus (strain DJM 731) TaxID=1858805 RepID=M5G9S1_DACPD|nr:DnaJ-domain-containing protein [Dacryopinax primogenitus]EJU05040.1 DnaJ-domain-containing protein [Dacryopinax primogenitus]
MALLSSWQIALLWLSWVILSLAAGADYYKILDVARTASEQDIKKAYKKLSRKFHPDKNKSPGAEERFVDIATAYEVLSDPKQKLVYDQFGEEGLKKSAQGQQHHANPFDMFSQFFGGGMREDQVRRGPTMMTEFEISLADAYTGNSIDFMLKKKVLCDHCRGSGAASDGDVKPCGGCNGSGVKYVRHQIMPGMFAQSQMTCDECQGRGKIIARPCPHCGGAKVLDHTAHYTLEVEPGIPEGHEVVFEGEADESPDWEAGDVVLKVRMKKEQGGWRRKEGSLYWRETIGVQEALLGFERNLTHLDGHVVTLRKDGVTQPGFVQQVKGEGMPLFERHKEHGDLFIEYTVVLPTSLSDHTKRALQDVFREGGHKAKTEL